jgi:hypothetical protein
VTAEDRACAVQLLRSAAADHLTHLDPAERDELVERISAALDRCAAKAWDEGYLCGYLFGPDLPNPYREAL